MNEEKMSLAEIAKLRETAQTERATRKKFKRKYVSSSTKKVCRLGARWQFSGVVAVQKLSL